MRRRVLPLKQRQLITDLTPLGLPEVSYVGVRRLRAAWSGITPHIHEGVMEICYLVRGQQTYHVDGQDYTLCGNQVFWTHPDEEHGTGDHIHGRGVLYWLHLKLPRKPAPFLCMKAADSWPLIQEMRALPKRQFTGDQRLQVVFEEIVLLSQKTPSPLVRLAAANRLVEWLLLIRACAHNPVAQGHSAEIAAALAAIDADPAAEHDLSELAEAAHLSTSHFKSKFRKEVGIAPGEYIARRKVARAMALLRTGRYTVTEVAYKLGFSTSQYFATVFRRFTSLSATDVIKHRAIPMSKLDGVLASDPTAARA
jgi:AraC-like DNA-binding protein